MKLMHLCNLIETHLIITNLSIKINITIYYIIQKYDL